MANPNEETQDESAALALTEKEMAALVPASIDALASPNHTDTSAPEKRRVSVPYVGFRGKKAEKNLEALDAVGIKVDRTSGNGVFYLMDVEPLDIRIPGSNAVALHVIQFARFYTLVQGGKDVAASLENNDDLFNEGYREQIYAIVAAVTAPGKFTAATLQLHSAQCKALGKAIDMLGEPGRPGPAMNAEAWGKRSAAHAKTVDTKIAGFRFRTEIWSTLEAPKYGDGEKFNLGEGRVYPTPESEFVALNAWAKDNWPKIQVAVAKYNLMVEKTKRLALSSVA